MTAKTMYVLVVLTIVVAAVLAVNPDCSKLIGDRTFSIRNLCQKTYNVFYSSDPQRADCITSKAECNDDGTVTITSKLYLKGELNTTFKIKAKDVGPGQVQRTFPDSPGTPPITQVVLSYSEIEGGLMKFSSLLCRNGETDPFLKTIAANYEKADFTDELKTVKNLYTKGSNLALLSNTCVAKDSF